VTASAFLNTDVAASFAAITWLLVEWARGRQPKFIGLLTGAVAGLATITPCAGYVSPTTAVIVGVAAGLVCYYAVALKNMLGWDDALDVWGVHGAGGFLGIVLLGVFASTLWNPNGADGLLRVNLVTRVKVDELAAEEAGLDVHLHGEEAYPLGV
jgi:Amt family ammonium transporter